IPQWREECRRFFGCDLVHISSRAQAHRILRGIKAKVLAPTWYITHYEALAINGVRTDSIAVLDRIDYGTFIRQPRQVICVRGKAVMAEESVIHKVTTSDANDDEQL